MLKRCPEVEDQLQITGEQLKIMFHLDPPCHEHAWESFPLPLADVLSLPSAAQHLKKVDGWGSEFSGEGYF